MAIRVVLALLAALQAPPAVRTLQAEFYGIAKPGGVFSFEEAMKAAEITDLVRATGKGTPAVDQTLRSLRQIEFDTASPLGQRIAQVCANTCRIVGEIAWQEPNDWTFASVSAVERLSYNFDFASLAPKAATTATGEPLRDLRDTDPLRQTLVDTLRVDMEVVLGQPLKLAASIVRTQANWAYIVVQPQSVTGGKVDFERTRFYEQWRRGPWDGGVTHALYKRIENRWTLTAYVVSPVTKSLIDRWPGDYGAPARLLGL